MTVAYDEARGAWVAVARFEWALLSRVTHRVTVVTLGTLAAVSSVTALTAPKTRRQFLENEKNNEVEY